MMDIPRPEPKKTTRVPREESSVVQFVKYNNMIPIVLGIIFLGATGTMAATPEVRDAIYTANARTVSVDNTRVLAVNPETYPFSIQIRSVKEDTEKYYVQYTLTTLGLVEGVWTDTALAKELVVYKSALGDRDLGTYVSAELAEVRDYERRLLAETQAIERANGVSQKVVATTYDGLVGKYLSPTEEVITGYQPVIAEGEEGMPEGTDPNRLSKPVASLTFDANAAGGPALVVGQTQTGAPTTAGGADTTAPDVSLMGEATVTVSVGGSYSDLGVAATDNVSRTLRIRRFVNGLEVSVVTISTAAEATYSIRYVVSDAAGNTTERARTVIVGAQTSGGGGSSPEPVALPVEEPEPVPEAPSEPSTPPSDPAPEPSSPSPEAPADTGGSEAGGTDGASAGGESSGGESAPSE